MPVLNMTDQMTALELVRRANAPDPFKIIELMRMTNEMLIDVPAYPANDSTVNVTLQRNIVPMGEHRVYNQGVGKAATQTKIVYDRIAMLAEYADVDANLVEHSGNVSAARMSEAAAIVKGMGFTQAQTIVYGDDSKSDEFAGIYSRRNSLLLPDGKKDPNVIDAGGTGNELTSIVMVAVGSDLFHLIYPKGSATVGVTRHDRGPVDIPDPKSPGKYYPGYRDYFEAQYGIAVKAPDAVKRICNIPKTITPDDLLDIILDTRWRMPQGATTYAMYSNMDVLVKIDKAARDKNNVAYTKEDPWGHPITHVRDLRCRRMDVILNTEEKVA